MAQKRMGFEGILLYGTAGSTASTQILNSRDINETFDFEEGDTTVRGNGSTPPISTSRVTGITYSLEFQMLDKADDTVYAALMAAATSGAPVALRTKSFTSGLGYDGDCIISAKRGKPLKGEATTDFTAKPNDDLRAPLLNV